MRTGEQDRKFECQGRKIALIVINCHAHPNEVSAEDVVDTDSSVLKSDIGSLSNEDILAEFHKENQMEVDDGNVGNKDELQERTPKRPTKSEVHQAIMTLSRYSLFVVEIQQQTSQLSFTLDKIIRKKQILILPGCTCQDAININVTGKLVLKWIKNTLY